MVFAFAMRQQIVLPLEPFRTIDAVPFSQSRKILGCFGRLVLGQMRRGGDVGFDLVKVSI